MQRISRHDKNAGVIIVWHVDHPQIPAARGLAKRDSRTIPTGPVLRCVIQNVVYIRFAHTVIVDVRETRIRIDIVADVHVGTFRGKRKGGVQCQRSA